MAGAGQDEAARGAERAASYSGRLLLRMPEGLHAELARASERNGSSLNAFITAALASAIGWQGADGSGTARRRRAAATQGSAEAAPAPGASGDLDEVDAPRRSLLERLLVVNLVVVVVVGALATVLLVRTLG